MIVFPSSGEPIHFTLQRHLKHPLSHFTDS